MAAADGACGACANADGACEEDDGAGCANVASEGDACGSPSNSTRGTVRMRHHIRRTRRTASTTAEALEAQGSRGTACSRCRWPDRSWLSQNSSLAKTPRGRSRGAGVRGPSSASSSLLFSWRRQKAPTFALSCLDGASRVLLRAHLLLGLSVFASSFGPTFVGVLVCAVLGWPACDFGAAPRPCSLARASPCRRRRSAIVAPGWQAESRRGTSPPAARRFGSACCS